MQAERVGREHRIVDHRFCSWPCKTAGCNPDPGPAGPGRQCHSCPHPPHQHYLAAPRRCTRAAGAGRRRHTLLVSASELVSAVDVPVVMRRSLHREASSLSTGSLGAYFRCRAAASRSLSRVTMRACALAQAVSACCSSQDSAGDQVASGCDRAWQTSAPQGLQPCEMLPAWLRLPACTGAHGRSAGGRT